MKEDTNIEELLNAYIDGELTQRQQTEVQRLVSHDPNIAARLRQLAKIKMLVSSLPRFEAPAHIVQELKTALQTGRLSVEQPVRAQSYKQEGARQLLMRRIVSAAAMIALVGVLAVVVYTIVAPETGPAESTVARRPEAGVVKETLIPAVTRNPAVRMDFTGRLELETTDLVAVADFIDRAVEQDGLSEKVAVSSGPDRRVFTLNCGTNAASLFLAQLDAVWDRLESARLLVETDRIGRPVVVNGVTTEQVRRIVAQDGFNQRIETARHFAMLNSIDQRMPGRELLAAVDASRPEPILTVKPRLTRPLPEDDGKVNLTIEVRSVAD